MNEVISSLTSAFTLAFVITSMFGLGLSMTIRDIIQPLTNVRLVLMALLANFVIIPALAFILTRVLSLEQDLAIALVLLGTVAGAPLTIRASQIARGDMHFAGALVILQVLVTVVYLPFVLPLLIPGIEVDTVAIAMQLIVQVLLPLAAGLLMNYRYDEEAEMTRPLMTEISNISLAVMIVLNLGNIGQVIGFIGTGSILAVLAVVVVGFVVGYVLGGSEVATKRVLSIGTAQRNYAAALVIATDNFADQPNVLLLLLAASLISIILAMIVAGEFGRRAKASEVPAVEKVPDKA